MIKWDVNKRVALKFFTMILLMCMLFSQQSTIAFAGTGYILNGKAKEWNWAVREVSLRHGDVLELLSKSYNPVTFIFEDSWGTYKIKGAGETWISNVHFMARNEKDNITVELEDIVASAPLYITVPPEEPAQPADFIRFCGGKNTVRGKGNCRIIAGNSVAIRGGDGIWTHGDLVIEGSMEVAGGYGITGGGEAISAAGGSLTVKGDITVTGGDTQDGHGGYGLYARKDMKIEGTITAKGGKSRDGSGGFGIYSSAGGISLNGNVVAQGGKGGGVKPRTSGRTTTGGYAITAHGGNVMLTGEIDATGGDSIYDGGAGIYVSRGNVLIRGNVNATGGNGEKSSGVGSAIICEAINIVGALYPEYKVDEISGENSMTLTGTPKLKFRGGKIGSDYANAISTFDYEEMKLIPMDYTTITGIENFNVKAKSEGDVTYELTIESKLQNN